ncbi:MAG TPA: hypothetical protein VF465_11165 [Flavobacterium sp.]|uniref:hypothetical protein n=1 Tax=Flavobacterium sp. TaxID=239 RepID=UPI002ED324BB
MTRKKSTLAIGDFSAKITQAYCESCHKIYGGEEIYPIIPKHSRFGFDIIEHIGKELFIEYRSDESIRKSLQERNISISLREISYIGKKFIVYLALAHQAAQDKIKGHMKSNGGYILHLDGTCEGDSPHLFSFIDEISKIVLDNIKIPSENAQLIKPHLEEIKRNYGDPVAIVQDMSAAIIRSVESIFPLVPDFICHLHFLRDIGKDLFTTEYNSIRRSLKTLKIRTILRSFVKQLKIDIEKNEDLRINLNCALGKNFFENNMPLKSSVSCYLLMTWVLESKNQSHGYGFPFDRPHVDFYDRLQAAYPLLINLKKDMSISSLSLPLKEISRALNDYSLVNSLKLIKNKIIIFDELRDAMRIVMPDGKNGLNDQGDDGIKTIESRVKQFRESKKIIQLSKSDIRFKKMVKQIDKYWKKLFADPIVVKTETGDVVMQPQRTNNLLEQFFRDIKSGGRKKSGTSSLSKKLKAMLANTPLVKNLKIPEYVRMILDGKKNLAERFAEIDITKVQKELQFENEIARKYPKGMARIFKLPDLPHKINQLVQKAIANS